MIVFRRFPHNLAHGSRIEEFGVFWLDKHSTIHTIESPGLSATEEILRGLNQQCPFHIFYSGNNISLSAFHLSELGLDDNKLISLCRSAIVQIERCSYSYSFRKVIDSLKVAR